MAAVKQPAIEIAVGERTVRISNPDRVYFPALGATKLDLVNYYISVGDGIVNALRERPCMLHRFPTGIAGDKVHQKRVPAGAPEWLGTVRLHFPRYGLHADELCVTELAEVIWAVQMSTVEFHPWNSRRADTERPDEWRIDLDPMPDCEYQTIRRVAGVAHEVLDELGAVGWPKTSGGRGIHIYVRIAPDHGFPDVRRAALAFAREVERRAPTRRHHDLVAQGPRSRPRSSSITTRTPVITRSPRRTPCAAFRMHACRHPSRGARSTMSTPRTSRSRPCQSDSPSSVISTPGSTRPSSPSTRCSNGRERDEQSGATDPGEPDHPEE